MADKNRATKQSIPGNISLVYTTEENTELKLQSIYQKQKVWVVSSNAGAASRYHTIFSNLQGDYLVQNKNTVDSIRDTLIRGLRHTAFDRLKCIIDISGKELSQIVRIPPRTVARRKLFTPDESERILRVASTFQRAIEVLGSLEKARRWFSSPKRALGTKTPMEFCDTEPGADEVENLLGRIEQGVFT